MSDEQMNMKLSAVRIHKKQDGYLLIDNVNGCRFLNFVESLAWRFFKHPPKGTVVKP